MQSRMKLSLVKFSHRVMRLSVILTAMIVIAQAQSSGPDYSNVKDFAASTHLLRNDDLVMTFTYQNPSSELRQVMFTAGSTNSSANVAAFSAYSVIPQGQAGCNTPGGCYLDFHYYDFLNTATGRFFNTDRDTTVLYPFQFSNQNNPLLISMAGQSFGTGSASLSMTTAQDVSFVTGGSHFISYVADFNGDGYDDLLMAWSNENAFPSNPKMVIATAVDVNNPTKGFRFGPMFTPASPYGIRQVTVGDFNGDGEPEIVQAYIDPNRQLTLATYAVDPATLTISEGGQLVYLDTVDLLIPSDRNDCRTLYRPGPSTTRRGGAAQGWGSGSHGVL